MGIAMILGLLTPINTGFWIIVLNIPILVIGWLMLGRTFIFNSLFSVVITSVSMQFIPLMEITHDTLLSAAFGGVIAGIAIGLIIRYYGSTGGFDVIGLILTRNRDFPIGGMIFVMNSVVVFMSGFVFDWNLALYTMASIYITGAVIDRVHTNQMKLTLMVVTSRGEEVRKELLANLLRGITVIDGVGAYSGTKREVLYSVITRYELSLVKSLIKKTDPDAFVNISRSEEVMGNFRRTT